MSFATFLTGAAYFLGAGLSSDEESSDLLPILALFKTGAVAFLVSSSKAVLIYADVAVRFSRESSTSMLSSSSFKFGN